MGQAMRMAGVIVGGGDGARLGGVVKPLLRCGGQTLLERTIARMRTSVSPLCLSIGAVAPERFAGAKVDLVVPDVPGVSGGPLAGIFVVAAALRRAGADIDWLLSVAGDCPDLPDNLPQALLAGMVPGADVVFAAFAGQSHPPNALWRFPALLAAMDAQGGGPQGMGPRRLFPPERRRDVDFAEQHADNPFAGFNTLADIVRHARAAAAGRPGGSD